MENKAIFGPQTSGNLDPCVIATSRALGGFNIVPATTHTTHDVFENSTIGSESPGVLAVLEIGTDTAKAAGQALRPRRNPLLSPRFAAIQKAFLSSETKSAIDKAVGSAPVVLFMKGTPETPQCGFSRASIQILGLQGVNPQKFTAFNVLEDEELRSGT